MSQRTWIVALLLALSSGCATPPASVDAPDCAPAAIRPVYLDIQDFQQALNKATHAPRGNWSVGVDAVFARFDGVIKKLERQRADQSKACPANAQELAGQLERLRIVRARGEDYLDRLRAHLKAGEAALAKLRKGGLTEGRLGDVQVRLASIDDGGQSFTLELRNRGKKAQTVATHYEPGVDRPDTPVMRPGYFMLTDEFGNHYPLAAIAPAYPPQAPLILAPGRSQTLRIGFGEPYAETVRKLTLHVDPSLVVSDPQRLRRAPAALVLPAALIPRAAQPRFVAEPGSGGQQP